MDNLTLSRTVKKLSVQNLINFQSSSHFKNAIDSQKTGIFFLAPLNKIVKQIYSMYNCAKFFQKKNDR